MSKFVIIDGNAIIHRSYHALPPLTTRDGTIVNAVYGFASTLLKVMSDIKPEYIAVTFDMAGPTFRHDRYKEYKATRVKADQALYDQIPLAHQLVEAFNIPIYEKKGYEADDVIGTVTKKILAHKKGIETFIVTGDMDTLQLVNHHTKVYTLRKGLSDVVVYDIAAVKERYGFGPELMVDYKALRGDPSDNIPGVPGIGEKTATELIQKVGGIEEIYKMVGKLSAKGGSAFGGKDLKIKESVIKKLVAGEEKARMSRELSEIDCDVPELGFKLGDCQIKPFDREKIVALFQKFEFYSLLKRVPGVGEVAVGANSRSPSSKGKPKKSKTSDFVYQEIKKADDLNKLLKLFDEKKKFAAEAITSGADLFSVKLTGLLIVVEAHGFYVPEKFLAEVLPIFGEEKFELVGHELKRLVKVLAVANLGAPGRAPLPGTIIKNHLFDIMIASYLLSPGSRSHDAPNIVLKELGKELVSAAGQDSLFGADYRLLTQELYLISLAGEQLRRELEKADNYGLLEKIEMPTLMVLAEMELNGVAVDKDKLAEMSERVRKEIDRVSKKIYEYAGKEFNIASPIQLREVLFDELQIPVEGIKKGKTGLSTSAEQLEKMKGLHPIIDEIEMFRELSKLQNTYIDVLPTLINPTTNRIHTTFNQAVAATGRLSSTDPNLQNIPIRTELGREIREAFIAEKGNVLVSADYSQIELRIVASLAEDKKMIEIFNKGEDIHAATAAAINNVPLEKVTKDMRRAAKEVNFGVLYGMGTYGLSWRAGITHGEAKDFIEKYFREFSGVKKYIDQTLEFTKKEGFCETLFGRRRYIPELQSTNFQLRSAGERMAINHPIQGTAADLMKLGMIEVHKKLQATSYKLPPKLVLQVHDEVVLEVPEKQAEEIGKMLKETMESVTKLRVPIEVHVSKGKSWGKMETLKH